ncbi:KN motif and ankyrin repeat domain-containing protein 1-like isoform X2 [Branchiostoma floridae]|uniref:KN motif and ankyrin repeat domain-containing protein 1-like isoform X2 n=1 Tax=Branchiostoma floridae TaxID=7739 RepID=A0A9J7NCV9_BRAFL|nr:KN motif and ankyrin repeat domain-containing protein 1-like isoform X2 [Branchiostoma floridae]
MRKGASTVDYATMRDKDIEKPADAESGFGDMESDTPEANPKVDLSPDGKCSCCPYGYHIDLDFLKYCDDISKGSNIPKIVRPRKPKSPGGPLSPAMDYRANTLPRGFYLNSQQSNLPRHAPVVPSSPISPLSVNTSLSSAINSIPETVKETTATKQTVPDPRENASSVYGYNSSTRRPSLPGDLPIPFTSPNSNSVFTMPAALANQSNSGSSSSLSSQLSTQSSSGQFSPHSEMSGDTKHSLGVQTPASLLSPGSSSRGSGASTPQPPAVSSAMLQGIREQIAASLKRIKVLEEQVKEIPVLQVKISVLKEEKRLLMMQLKSKNGEQNLKPEDTNKREKRDDDKDSTKRLHRRSLSTGSFQMLEQQWKEQQAEQEKQKPSKGAPEPSEKNGTAKKAKVPPPVPPRSFRSVSVGDTTSLSDIVCYNSALRTSVNVGTNTTVPSRDVGVGYSPRMRHVGVGISNDLLQQELGIVENQKCNTAVVETSEVGVGVSVEQRAVAVGNHTESRDVGMTTEPEVVKKQKTKHATRSIGVIVDIPETKDVRTVGVGSGSISEQEKPLAETASVSTNTPTVNTIDKVTNTVAVNLKTVAVGNFSVKDLLCDRCADVKTKTVAVGACSIKDTICDRCNNMESKTVGVGRCTINDTVCDKCTNLKTRSIGCATLANWNQKSVSVLAKVEQSDVGTGDSSVLEETDSGKDQTETKDIGVGEDSIFPLEDVKLPVQTQVQETVSIVSSPTESRPPLEIIESSSSDEVEDEDMIPPLQQASIIKTTEPQVAEVQPVHRVVRETVVRETVVTVTSQDGYEELDGEVKEKKEEEEKESLEAVDGFENKHALSPGSSPAISNLRPLRSCLKGKHSTKKVNIKKEIQFVGVNGNGHDESSSDDSSSEESSEDETDDEDSSSSESESSDEGGYNCELGKVIKKGKEEQGKKDVKTISSSEIICEDIKEAHELSEELQEACGVLEKHVTTPKSVPPRELMMAMNTIQHEWMKAGAQKTSDVHVVRDYLAAFEQMASGVIGKIVNLADGNGNTALHYSVSHSNFDIVEILLETGQCEVNKQNKAGYTAIMLASLAKLQGDRQMEVVKKLFQSGDVNIRATQAGQTALMLAVSHGRQEIVKMLIDAGAEVNLQDEDGSTALMCASEHGHLEIVKLLLAQPGCDATITDNDDSTALSIAMEAGHRDIGVLLYAQVNMGKTAPGGGKGRRLSPSPTRRKSP